MVHAATDSGVVARFQALLADMQKRSESLRKALFLDRK